MMHVLGEADSRIVHVFLADVDVNVHWSVLRSLEKSMQHARAWVTRNDTIPEDRRRSETNGAPVFRDLGHRNPILEVKGVANATE